MIPLRFPQMSLIHQDQIHVEVLIPYIGKETSASQRIILFEMIT